MEGTAIEIRLWELDENLQRADLSPAERKAHMAERVRLVIQQQQKEVSAQNAPKLPSRTKLKAAVPAEQHKPSGRPKDAAPRAVSSAAASQRVRGS